MTWKPEALRIVRELKTNCSDFIYKASEWLAEQRGHETVEREDVQTVIAFVENSTEKAVV